MVIEFMMREQFGHIRYFGQNKNAQTILKLMKRKTLDPEQIKICKEAEWEVKVSYVE